ncbi:MAG TPA: solute carrier family 23 protein, partial [Flavisolibacter sp.]
VSVMLSELFSTSFPALAVEAEHRVQVPMASSLSEFVGLLRFPDFSALQNQQVYTVALTLAAVASIETLLCIEAVDKLDPHRRVTDQNRELRAQGIGNIVSGLLGGLPITSVIVRSSANINSNAQTKMSAILHGVMLLATAMLIPGLLNRIPLAALAAILLVTGYKLAKISIFRQMFSNGKYQWIPFLVTVVTIVTTDLLTGVAIGLATSAVAILYGNLKNSYYFHRDQHHEGEMIRIHLSEEVSFLNKASIKQTLRHLPDNSIVVIDARDTQYIDFDVLELIREFRDVQAQERGITCYLVGFRDKYGIDNTHNVTSEAIPKGVLKPQQLVAVS